MKTTGKIGLIAAVGAGLAVAPSSLLACATCYGDPQSSMTKGLNLGILTLLGVTVLVLGGVGAFIFSLARRARRHAVAEFTAQPAGSTHP